MPLIRLSRVNYVVDEFRSLYDSEKKEAFEIIAEIMEDIEKDAMHI